MNRQKARRLMILSPKGIKADKKAESIMVGFRMDEDTLERLDRLTNGLGKKRINILRASLLAFESLSPSDKAKFLIEIMR